MSYNIDTVHIVKMKAQMTGAAVLASLEDEQHLPEDCFLWEMNSEIDLGNLGALIDLPNLNWIGTMSGVTFRRFKKEIAPLIKGEVQAIFFWEGGESVTGLAIKDGKVVECDVEYILKLPEGW